MSSLSDARKSPFKKTNCKRRTFRTRRLNPVSLATADSNGRPTGILLSSYSGNDQSLLSAALSIEHILHNND
jgi:hypothetical protein